jgi:ankyrin repeat domain-containing protein 50
LKQLEQKETVTAIVQNLKATLSMNDAVTAIHRKVLSDEDEKVIAWLGLNNAPINHDLARKKHEPKTGDWFLQSEKFITWTNAKRSSLWLRGKAGSGKTILCSTIIDHVIKMCDSNSTDRYAYFYFDFNSKWTAVDMLRSIIVQLCTSQIPPELHQLYQECVRAQRQPHQISLIKIFSALLTTSHRTFVILDALDECEDRNKLLEIIIEMMASSSTYLNILVTSRKEQDIEDELVSLINTLLNLEEAVVDRDIALYIQQCKDADRLKV